MAVGSGCDDGKTGKDRLCKGLRRRRRDLPTYAAHMQERDHVKQYNWQLVQYIYLRYSAMAIIATVSYSDGAVVATVGCSPRGSISYYMGRVWAAYRQNNNADIPGEPTASHAVN